MTYRIPELDALRGLAAISIVLYHLFGRDVKILRFNWAGVDLFFVLSGYLITSKLIYMQKDIREVKAFITKRCWRICPAYYLGILMALGISGFRHFDHYRVVTMTLYLTFTQNIQLYWFGHALSHDLPLEHTWSVAIEMQYYLIWTTVVLLLGEKSLDWMLCSMLVISVLARGVGFHPWILLARCDGFSLGGMIALVQKTMNAKLNKNDVTCMTIIYTSVGALAILLMTVIIMSFGNKELVEDMGIIKNMDSVWTSITILVSNVFFFSLIGLIVLHAGHPVLALLRMRPLCYLGKISYGLYIYHPLIWEVVDNVGSPLGFGRSWRGLLALVVSLAIAMFSWKYFERRFMAVAGE